MYWIRTLKGLRRQAVGIANLMTAFIPVEVFEARAAAHRRSGRVALACAADIRNPGMEDEKALQEQAGKDKADGSWFSNVMGNQPGKIETGMTCGLLVF